MFMQGKSLHMTTIHEHGLGFMYVGRAIKQGPFSLLTTLPGIHIVID